MVCRWHWAGDRLTVSPSRSLELLRELLALGADFVDQLSIRGELLAQRNTPRPGIRLRIVDRHFNLEMAKVGPVDALANRGGLGYHAAVPIYPDVVAESVGVDDQRVVRP